MPRILVAGGTGALGSDLVARLKNSDYQVRVLSRQPAPADTSIEWAQGDTITGEGLDAALAGVDVVANCTGNPRDAYQTDVLGVKRLAEMSKSAKIPHFFHISIVGIEHFDVPFYRNKVEAETAIINSGAPYSILRVVQFHGLLHVALSKIEAVPEGYALPIAPDAHFQTIDTHDVADYMLPLLANPAGRLTDLGGPEILRVADMARTYLAARGVENPTFVASPNKFFSPSAEDAYRQGVNTVPSNRYGKITWADYVRARRQ